MKAITLKRLQCAALSVLSVVTIMSSGLANASESSDKVTAIQCFPEPVAPCKETDAAEDAELAAMLTRYAKSQARADLDALAGWATSHASSGWAPSVLVGVGGAYYRGGYFSRALESWRLGW